MNDAQRVIDRLTSAGDREAVELLRRWQAALVDLSIHDFTGFEGCRRGQGIAARALHGELVSGERSSSRKAVK